MNTQMTNNQYSDMDFRKAYINICIEDGRF